jgi:hypothetical protein
VKELKIAKIPSGLLYESWSKRCITDTGSYPGVKQWIDLMSMMSEWIPFKTIKVEVTERQEDYEMEGEGSMELEDGLPVEEVKKPRKQPPKADRMGPKTAKEGRKMKERMHADPESNW